MEVSGKSKSRIGNLASLPKTENTIQNREFSISPENPSEDENTIAAKK